MRKQWCSDINRAQSDITYDFIFVDQEGFDKYQWKNFNQLATGFQEYKE